jgi:hypothetical protein
LVLTVVTTRMPVSAPRTEAHDKNKAMNVFMAWRRGLTSRAQARGTNQREPRSGTGDAIPRCLQRFVRQHGLLVIHVVFVPVQS